MQLPLVAADATLFTVARQQKLLIAEASDVRVSLFQQLYDDAADKGFAIYNKRTDVTTHWSFVWEELDQQENELLACVFAPTRETLLQQPQLSGWRVTVYND